MAFTVDSKLLQGFSHDIVVFCSGYAVMVTDINNNNNECLYCYIIYMYNE